MVDSNEVIHARSERLVESMNQMNDGIISLDEMLAIIGEEEKTANLKPSADGFFDAMRELTHKAYDSMMAHKTS